MSLRLAALYAAVTLLLAYPLSLQSGSHVVSSAPDTDLFLWTLAWDAHALVTNPLAIFDANIYAPQPLTLAYSENLVGSALLATPVLWLTGNVVLAMNVAALASCVLCGLGAAWLARRTGISAEGAMMTGLVFAFSPPRFLRLDQMHLIAVQWIPFALASAHAYLENGRRRDLWLLLAFFTLQVLASGHGAVFLAVALAALLAWHTLLRGRPIAPVRALADMGWRGALLAAPVVATIAPYLIVQRQVGLRRTLDDWWVPATSFLASPSRAWVAVLSLLPGARINETAGAYLFPGVVPLVLASLALVGPRLSAAAHATDEGRRGWSLRAWLAQPSALYLGVALVALWLSAGPPVGLWPLVYWLPGLNFVRAPSRFVLLAILGVAVLAGFGFDRIVAGRTRRRLATGLVAACLVAEFAAIPLGTEPYRVEIPAIDRWLAGQPGPFTVAEVPLPDSRDLNRRERRQTLYMLHSTAHWQKTVHGYSGLRPPQYDDLYRALLRFPDEDSLAKLQGFGVTYVVVHEDLYQPDEWQTVQARIGTYADRLRLLHTVERGRVYALQSGPGGAAAAAETAAK